MLRGRGPRNPSTGNRGKEPLHEEHRPGERPARPRAAPTNAFDQTARVTHDVVVLLCVLGVVGQVVAVALAVCWLLSAAGVEGPLRLVRELAWGYELWLVFAVAFLGTAGSLFLSEVAHYPPCELCWYQRICLYPLTVLSLMAALRNDYRIARYMLPFPVVGFFIAGYQVL